MVIAEGYKKTEIGVVPEDWEVQPLSNLFSIGHGKDQKEIEEKGGKFPILATSGVIGYTNKFLYNKPSALIGRKGTINKPQYTETPFWTIDTLFYTKVFDNAFPKYIYYIFCVIDWLSLNEASGVPSLSAYNIEKIRCAIPSLSEQRIIANALSDVDSMISSLEKLIEKKKAVKQGAMQELLTGKKRLPGFVDEWEEMSLGDLCYLITKQTGFDYTNEIKPSLVEANTANTIPFIQNKDFNGKSINLKTDYFVPVDIATKYPKILLNETCMLISLSGKIGNVGFYEKTNGISFIGGAVGICRFNNENLAEWCMLFLQSSIGQKQIFESQKSGAQHNLTVEDVRKLLIKKPSAIEEQRAIASILSDMDNEIDALEQKLKKARQLKQGMMQQLLTGKIRLV